MLTGLKAHEAIKTEDVLLVQLEYGVYSINDGEDFIGSSRQVTINSTDTLYKVNRQAPLLRTITNDEGVTLSAQDYNKLLNKYYDEDEDETVYPSLEEEFEHRKTLNSFKNGTKEFTESVRELQKVDIKVIGIIEETGSEYISTPIHVGNVSFKKQGFYKLDVLNLLTDALVQFCKEKNFVLDMKTSFEFFKVNEIYINTNSEFKNINKTPELIFTKLKDAKNYETEIKEKYLLHVKTILNDTALDKIKVSALYNKLTKIYQKIFEVEFHVKTKTGQHAITDLQRQMRTILKDLESHN